MGVLLLPVNKKAASRDSNKRSLRQGRQTIRGSCQYGSRVLMFHFRNLQGLAREFVPSSVTHSAPERIQGPD
jgi:hypothetical protein